MPNHYREDIIEAAKASHEETYKITVHPIQRWAWKIALGVFVFLFLFYLWHFHGSVSDDHGTWGEFGDFMGGIVNPIVGLLTIYLLTISLNQSHLSLHQTSQALSQAEAALKQSAAALKQSAAEIELAKQALLDNQKIQKTSEAARARQVEIAEETRDIANASALWGALQRKSTYLREAHHSGAYISLGHSSEDMYGLIAEAEKGLTKLEHIMAMEIDRLDGKYNKRP